MSGENLLGTLDRVRERALGHQDQDLLLVEDRQVVGHGVDVGLNNEGVNGS